MKVLVIGAGGREHAIVWALRRSERVSEVVCAPGNAGIAQLARCLPVDLADLPAMVHLVESERPDLTVIGPELPLALGIVDALQPLGHRVFGPSQAAARLESSKAFAKDFMRRHDIPTAAYAVCRSIDSVRRELSGFDLPIVVKADGLAAGKGVVICSTHAHAEAAAAAMFSGELLGAPVEELVIEQFLAGEEISFFALCDGTTAVPLALAQDHKRIGEGDTGPNTGGMGAYSTDGLVSPELLAWLNQNVAQAVVDGMSEEGSPFRGILFCGLMLTKQFGETIPMVLEFNTRFGDPETQAILLRLESDLLDLFNASIDGTAHALDILLSPQASLAVVAASAGYPGTYASGLPIHGLRPAETKNSSDIVFHSGTALRNGEIVTAGGRVLSVAALAEDLQQARALAYATLSRISFQGMQFRRDIGWRALRTQEL